LPQALALLATSLVVSERLGAAAEPAPWTTAGSALAAFRVIQQQLVGGLDYSIYI